MFLTDAHCHLQSPALTAVLPELWAEMPRHHIGRWSVNGLTQADWPHVAALARAHPQLRPSFGLHPWYLQERSADWREELAHWLREFPGSGVGEFGLDRWMPGADLVDQMAVFREHWTLAVQHHLPVTIHCLRAWNELETVLRDAPRAERGFLLHAYGGPAEQVPRWVERGAYFSFSTSFLGPEKARKREPFRRVPLDRLLIETDAPSMPPPPTLSLHPLTDPTTHRPLNHPANLPLALHALAELRGLSLPEMAGQLEENFTRWWGNA